jgi:hypothetical protein
MEKQKYLESVKNIEIESPKKFKYKGPANVGDELILERSSSIPKLAFGLLKPDEVPIFGYPFVNYSPPMEKWEKQLPEEMGKRKET